MPSEEELKAQEDAEKEKGEKGDKSGDKDKFASKEDLAAITKKIEEQGRKSDEVFRVLTSEEFMARKTEPPPPPPKTEEKVPTQEEINEMNMAQGLGYILKEVKKEIAKGNVETKESIANVAASIQRVTDVEADKDADRQIAQLKKDYGEDKFEKHRAEMVKIVAATPGITANRAYLIAIGEAEPPKKEEAPKGTETEKSGQGAEFTETDLKPKEAAEKAYDKAFGANENPI